jgi:regulatory protein
VNIEPALLAVRKKAMELLARREYSCLELETKLKRKGFEIGHIASVLQQLKSGGWQSDDRFVESYVRSRAASGFGPLRIASELSVKGVPKDLVNEYLNQYPNQFWMDKMQGLLNKRFSQPAVDQKTYAAQYRFLQQRGFRYDNITRILKVS